MDLDHELEIVLNVHDPVQREQDLLTLAEANNLPIEKVTADFNKIFEQRLIEKVRGFISPDLSPLERTLAKQKATEWLRNYIADRQEIKSLIESYATQEEEIIVCTLKEAFELNKEKSKYLVEELFMQGALYLVAAYAKTGKSLFATSLAVNSVLGAKFMNRRVTSPANVLFIQNEENIVQTATRAKNNGLQNLELQSPELYQELVSSDRFIIAKNLDIVQDLKKILNLVDKNKCNLLIIDSLSASIKKGGLSEQSPELLASLLTLQQHIQDRNITGMLIHHTTKADSNENQQSMLKSIAGTSGITRANDGIIKMMPNPKDKDHIDVHFLPRNGQQCKFLLTKEEGEACYWDFIVLEEESLSPENLNIQNKILRLLKEKYDDWIRETGGKKLPVHGYFLKEIEAQLSLNREIIIQRLNYMLQVEGIEVTGYRRKFLYHYPSKGESWLDQYLEEEDEKIARQKELFEIAEFRKNKILSFTTKEEIEDFTKDWNVEDKLQVKKAMTEEEFTKVQLIKNPPKYKEGDSVTLISIVMQDEGSNSDFEVSSVKYDFRTKKHYYTLHDHNGIYIDSDFLDK